MRITLRAAALSCAALLSACGFEIVDTGHRGVETRFGEVVSQALPEGLYFYNPFTSNIIQLDTRLLRYDDHTGMYTKDVQQAQVKFTLNYRLNAEHAHIIFKEVGRDWDNKLVPQVVYGNLKEVIGKWNAVELIGNRDKAQIEAFEQIRASLADKHVSVVSFEITDIEYTPQFEKSVEDKVIAEQRAIEEQNRTKQIEEQAKQKVLSAQAEAESIKIRAAALAQNARLVELEAVQRWDGHLPQYMMGSSVPFISLPAGK